MESYVEKVLGSSLGTTSFLRALRPELVEDLRFLDKGIKDYGTPDIFARKAYLSNNLDEYEKIKRTLCFYLILIQLINGVDKRYYAFLAAVIDRIGSDYSIRENLKIATWNYDIQLISALSELTSQNISVLNQKFGPLTDSLHSAKLKRNLFFRLNGYAASSFFMDGNQKYVTADAFDFIYNQKTNPSEKVIDLNKLFLASKNGEYLFNIRFAWENESSFERDLKDTINSISDTEILVVIGYSFPNFNRDVDKRLFSAMPNLRKIYLQDKFNYIESRILPLLDEDIAKQINRSSTEFSSDIGQFLIPHEL